MFDDIPTCTYCIVIMCIQCHVFDISWLLMKFDSTNYLVVNYNVAYAYMYMVLLCVHATWLFYIMYM